jgi:hypothetical protein
MVYMEPRGNKKKNEEVDVWIVTQGGEKIGMGFKHGESSS